MGYSIGFNYFPSLKSFPSIPDHTLILTKSKPDIFLPKMRILLGIKW